MSENTGNGYELESCKALAGKMLALAVKDAQRGTHNGREWLLHGDIGLWCDLLDIAVSRMREQVREKGT